MERLPDELLLKVATHLSAADLCNLAMVSQQFTPSAQDELYRSPCITAQHAEEQHSDRENWRLTSFVRTIVHLHPNLANRVRHLQLYLQDRNLYIDNSLLVGATPTTLTLLGSARAQVNECALAAAILDRVPHLEGLVLEMIDEGRANKHQNDAGRYCYRSLVTLFGGRCSTDGIYQVPQDLSQVPGLRGLKTLHVRGSRFEYPWLTLPDLEELHINGNGFDGTDASPVTSGVRALTVDCDALHCFVDLPGRSTLEGLFNRMPSLSRVSFKILPYMISGYNDDGTPRTVTMPSSFRAGFCDGLLGKLSSASSTLETLEIEILDDEYGTPAVLQYISPASAFSFPKLRHLTIPSELLVSKDPTTAEVRPIDLLPASIETLTIDHPFLTLIRLLQGVVEARDYFCNLREVRMRLSEKRGDGWSAHFRNSDVWRELEDMGVTKSVMEASWADLPKRRGTLLV